MEYLIFRVLNKLSSKINDSFLINMRIWLFKRNCLDLSDYNGTIFRTDLEESYQTFLSKNELSDKKYMNIILNDIIRCYLIYYITPDEYFLHDLMHKDLNYRKTILSRRLKDKYCIDYLGKNWKFYFEQLKDKWAFMRWLSLILSVMHVK